MIGETISHYRILEKVGEGGMGVVYKAEDTKLKRAVAIKFLPSKIAFEADERKRFMVEAQAAAALNHKNITTIYAIEEVENKLFIVMEYIEGKELKKIIADNLPKVINLREVKDYAIQIADGLQAAHEKGIVHRDVKSNNIMITMSGQVKIMDFGLAKIGGVSQLTKTGTTLGTISYMSPEQIQASDMDHRTDLWSLGVLLYEMLTGRLPFQGDYEAAVIYSILNDEPRAIQGFRPDVPDNIIELTSHLLQKDCNNRVASAKEIIDQLHVLPPKRSPKDEKKSLAVLYFENMSSDKENEYFCAGITEDLIIDLSKIQGLKIIPRSDVLPFRNKEVNTQQVGETLGVQYILEGSVRKGANKMRITAQLIDVKSGFQVWAERYDRLIEDIFDVQIEVSENIAEALKVSLTESEKQSLAKKPTDDLRAYDFFMRGSEFLLRRGRKDRETAIQMFEHAISIDHDFALAYVSLAEAYSFNYLFYGGDRAWLEKMMEMNEKALNLNPDLIEAQFGIGMVYFHQKRFSKAKGVFEKVIRTKNDFYPVQLWLAWTLMILGDFDAAISHCKTMAAMRPYSEEPWHFIEQSFMNKGQGKAAREAGDKVIELTLRRLEVNPKDLLAMSRMAISFAHRGESGKTLEAITKIVEIDPHDGMALYNCACAYAGIGKKEEALTCLISSYEKGTMNVIEWIESDPNLNPIRDDPRFREIISKFSV